MGHCTQEQLAALKSKVADAMFSCRVELTHPTLRSLMGLKEGEIVFHDVQVRVAPVQLPVKDAN